METKDTKNAYVRQVAEQKYEYGFTTDVHTDIIEKGLNEDVVRLISSKKGEPDWMLEFRLQAFRHWQTMEGRSGATCTCPTSTIRRFRTTPTRSPRRRTRRKKSTRS